MFKGDVMALISILVQRTHILNLPESFFFSTKKSLNTYLDIEVTHRVYEGYSQLSICSQKTAVDSIPI